MAQEELQLSPQEKRLLRRFFHRNALPYAAIALALAALAGASAHQLRAVDPGPRIEVPPAPAPVDLAAFEKTRVAAEALLAELKQAARRDEAALAGAQRRMSTIESGIAGAQEQLRELEARALAAAARVPAPAPPTAPAAPALAPDSAPADLNGLLERLYNLEVRQDQVEDRSASREAERTEAIKSILGRLYELEARTTAVEQAGLSATPAVPGGSDTR